MRTNEIKFSVIIPSYGENELILDSIDQVASKLTKKQIEFEIIVVLDGVRNKKDKTYEIALTKASDNVIVIQNKSNEGKGFALRTGFSKARGEVVGFIDAGGDIDASALVEGYKLVQTQDWDIACGNKYLSKSAIHSEKLLRKILSNGFRFGVRILFSLPIDDTQVGIKVFQREVLKAVLPFLYIKRFAFDVEFLVIAKSMGFTKMKSFPVILKRIDYNTTLSTGLIKNSLLMVRDCLAIWYRIHFVKDYLK